MTTVAFVVGEPSGDQIGADLIRSLRSRLHGPQSFVGLAGEAMQGEGMESLFAIDELSIIGIGGIVARLPQLIRRLGQTTDHILAAKPDVLVIIDSPTFSHRIAKRVRARLPDLPIINYVPPTVWAWREGRAAAMRPYVDHAICVLPFEPETMQRLGGPPSTYVGHPLLFEPRLRRIIDRDDGRRLTKKPVGSPPTLAILPGSRSGEINRLLGDFSSTFLKLKERVPDLHAVIPTLPRHRERIEAVVADLPVQPQIVVGEEAKWDTFARADAALAASGTVSLELALAGVPMALAYRLDPIAYQFRNLVKSWTAALPNFISGYPLVPEYFHELVRPEHLARRMQQLLTNTSERTAQLEGLEMIRQLMSVERSPGDAAAEIVAHYALNERDVAWVGDQENRA